ncbi:STU1 Protein STU1 [Candida maltosa Xu316]
MSNTKGHLNISPFEVLEIISSSDQPDETKLSHIQNLKTHIKKDTIDLRNTTVYIQIILKGLDIPNLNISSRLSVQDRSGSILKEESYLILPPLINKFGNASTQNGINSARKTLEDYWLTSPKEVEHVLLEKSFNISNIKITIETINWITQILKNISSNFDVDKFIPDILKSVKDHANNEELVNSVKELFRVYADMNPVGYEAARKEITELPVQLSKKVLPDSSRPSSTSVRESRGPDAELLDLLNKVNYEMDPSIQPIDVHDANSLLHTFEAFLPCYEDKETESNWKLREKNIIQMRSILRGNAPTQFQTDLVHCFHMLAMGMCKGASSLRTTLSAHGCQLMKECVIILQSSFEQISENIFPTLIKLCASTKSIASNNANMTVSALYANLPYTQRMIQRIMTASEERNHQPRSYSLIWLHVMLLRIGMDQSYIGNHEVVFIESANKVLMKLLKDANPNVRQVAKECYWCYTRVYPNCAEALLKKLEPNIVKALERSQRESRGSGIGPIRSFTSRPAHRSIKAAIIEKNKELRQKQPASRSSGELISRTLPKPNKGATASRLDKSSTSLPRPDAIKAHQASRASSWTPTQSHTKDSSMSRPLQRQRSTTEIHRRPPPPPSDIRPKSRVSQTRPSSRTGTQVPSFDKRNDPLISFLSSEDTGLLKEGIDLLKYAIIAKEPIPEEVKPSLKRISEKYVFCMKPLFTTNDHAFKTVASLLLPFDFLRICSVIFPEFDDKTFDLILDCIDVSTFYDCACRLLTCVIDSPNIPGSHAFVLQIVNHKMDITRSIMSGLLISLTKLPVTDVQFDHVFRELVNLIVQLKDSDNYLLLSQLFLQLYTINSSKFAMLLEDVEQKQKEEICTIIGVESPVVLPKPLNTRIEEMTEVPANFSKFNDYARKNATDFTMVVPKRSDFSNIDLSKPKLAHVAEESSPSRIPPFNGSPSKPVTSEDSKMLIDDFANVSITEDRKSNTGSKNDSDDTLKHYMDRIDPLKSIANKVRKISIFEDSKNDTTSKTDKKWSGYQHAKYSRTLAYNGTLDATSANLTIEEYEKSCRNLANTPTQSSLLKMTGLIDSLSNTTVEFKEYYLNKGKLKLEKALWEFFDNTDREHHQHRQLFMNGLFLLKQSIKFNESMNVNKLFSLLHSSCATEDSDSEMFFIWNEILLSIDHFQMVNSFEEVVLVYLESGENNLTISNLCLNFLAKNLLEDNGIDVVKIYRLDKIFGRLLNEDEVMFRKSAVVCYSNLFKNGNVSPEVKETLHKVKSKYAISQQRLIEFYIKR